MTCSIIRENNLNILGDVIHMSTFFKSDSTFKDKIAAFFDRKRYELKLSIKKMAELCGLTEANLSRVYIHKQGLDSFNTLSKLCHGHTEEIRIIINQTDYEIFETLVYQHTQDKEFRESLGKIMLNARTRKNISQRTLGVHTGNIFRERNISLIETGKILVEISNLEKYCEALKLQLIVVIKP